MEAGVQTLVVGTVGTREGHRIVVLVVEIVLLVLSTIVDQLDTSMILLLYPLDSCDDIGHRGDRPIPSPHHSLHRIPELVLLQIQAVVGILDIGGD